MAGGGEEWARQAPPYFAPGARRQGGQGKLPGPGSCGEQGSMSSVVRGSCGWLQKQQQLQSRPEALRAPARGPLQRRSRRRGAALDLRTNPCGDRPRLLPLSMRAPGRWGGCSRAGAGAERSRCPSWRSSRQPVRCKSDAHKLIAVVERVLGAPGSHLKKLRRVGRIHAGGLVSLSSRTDFIQTDSTQLAVNP